VTSLEVEQWVWFRGRAMANEQRKDETLQEYRDRLRREFRRDHPGLLKYTMPGPWDEKGDLFHEAVTGETLERPRES
jgi:hypothetical protein